MPAKSRSARPRVPRTSAPPPAPLPLPTEILPAAILRGPADFAAKLAAAPSRPPRYLGLVALSSLLSGVAYALLVGHAAHLAATLTEPGPLVWLTHVTNAFGGLFLGLLGFGMLWGVGHLIVRREGRAAEVYGATFSLLLPLNLLVIVVALLTPAAAWLPEQLTGNARAVERAALHTAAHTPAAAVLYAVTLFGPLMQGALAYPAFRRLTGDPARALAASTLPLLPALLLGFIGIAPLLLNR